MSEDVSDRSTGRDAPLRTPELTSRDYPGSPIKSLHVGTDRPLSSHSEDRSIGSEPVNFYGGRRGEGETIFYYKCFSILVLRVYLHLFVYT